MKLLCFFWLSTLDSPLSTLRIRIIFHLWKTRTPYDENVYIQQLKRRNSPLVKFLETP